MRVSVLWRGMARAYGDSGPVALEVVLLMQQLRDAQVRIAVLELKIWGGQQVKRKVEATQGAEQQAQGVVVVGAEGEEELGTEARVEQGVRMVGGNTCF